MTVAAIPSATAKVVINLRPKISDANPNRRVPKKYP